MNRYALPLLGFGVLLLAFHRSMVAPVVGRITSFFGEDRPGKPHNGVDVAVPVGTPVRAPLDGVVVLRNYTDAGGYQMKVKLSNGMTVGFAHLSEQLADLNASVQRGQVVALSGNTGQSTGPHVHLTLSDSEGTKVDPLDYFNLSA